MQSENWEVYFRPMNLKKDLPDRLLYVTYEAHWILLKDSKFAENREQQEMLYVFFLTTKEVFLILYSP